MSVVNGQIANQTTFNNAFMSRTAANTQTIAIVALENTEVQSGAFVQNLQRAMNKAYEGLGTTGETDTTINDYANQNYIANGDNRKVAIGKLDAQLKQTQDDLDADELIIADHETRLDAAELTIADHETRLDAAELTIADHETRISQNESDIAGHETRLDQHDLDLADHEDRITDLESNTMTIGGNKTFSGNVVVQGNFEVQGTLTAINSTNLEVEDQNILVNKNGSNASAENAGIDVERPAGNAAIRFDSTLASKFKIGLISNLYEVLVSGIAQTVSGIKNFVSGIKVDTINESTLNQGVTVDSVLIKDGLVDGRDVGTDGTTLDGHTSTLSSHNTRLTNLESNPMTIGGLKTFSGGIATNTIAERTANAGVTIDGLLLKDGLVDGRDVGTDGATLDTLGTRMTTAETNIVNLETRATNLESNTMTIAGNKTFSGSTLFSGSTRFSGDLFVDVQVNTQIGADIAIANPTDPLVPLTGVGLVSIGSIVPTTQRQIIWLLNVTGGPVTIKNELASATAANRIQTGTGADVVLSNNQIVQLVYELTAARWYASSVGGTSGGGGGVGGRKTFDMKLNGAYGGSAAYNGVDGLWVAPTNIEITNVYMYQDTAGSGGTTDLDLKVKPFLSGAFTSIFLTTPKMTNAAGANAWGGVGDTVTGFTAPVLTSLPFAVAAKSAIRMDLIGAQTGNAAGVGLIIEYEEI